MKLPKAIEVLKDWEQHKPNTHYLKEFEALKVVIEAAEGVIKFRSGSDTRHLWLLPGETLPEVTIVSDQPGESHPVVKGGTK